MKTKRHAILLLFLFLPVELLFCQPDKIPIGKFEDGFRDINCLRICFYNLENYFDPENDSLKNDDAFTPDGSNHYTNYRFKKKTTNMAKVIIAMGGWEAPEIIGICEVENDNAIKKLIYNSALNTYKYRFIHYESGDSRGIDVALLYRPDKFKVIYSSPIIIADTGNNSLKTRDILYVKGISPFHPFDTLHILVNHWPSRYGGYAQSIEKRNLVASVLRQVIDSLLCNNKHAAILIMGDFNDYPYDESIVNYLNASSNPNELASNQLLNTMFPYLSMNNIGSHKYQEHWGLLDQIIVSQSMISGMNGWKIKSSAVIFNADFLLEPDEKFLGTKTLRTYSGMKYLGGYSDHLPVFIDVICQ